MQSPSKRSAISLVGPPAFSGLQGWADLPDGLLHSIVARLGSFREILGFAATCPSWRAAYSSYPSKSTFLSKFPPLLVQPHVRVQGPLPSTDGCHELLTCKVIDPANPNTALHCQIPQETLLKMTCIGSSYGNLIYYHNGYCRIVDVFTGLEVSAPRLPPIAKCSIFRVYGILTAPLASSNSHLLVSTKSYLFDWPVGSDSWSQVRLPNYLSTDQIVEFNGQFILSDGNGWFHSVQLAPQLGLQMITTSKQDWSTDDHDCTRVVVCGDMLIVLIPIAYELYRLDVSTNPATVTTMEKLDDWALFFGEERKGTLLSCMSPEQWGGRSNTSYHALGYSEPCTFYGLSDEPDPEPDHVLDTPPAKLAWLLSNCRLEPWGQGSNLSQSASPDSDHWAPPRWGDETYTVQDIPFSQGSGSLEPWGQASNLSHSASLDYNHWNSPASRVSLYVGSDPWAPPPPQWDDDPNPAQDTPFSHPAQPLWLYPSMFYSGGSE